MAKDTEKLIRQLSLISFLMANGRPVSALEIKREVEGYSSMNDDAFARRFYADRAELESLGISLQVEKPAEGFFEAELYALPPENYYLRPIEFTDGELAALRTALGLLDGEFAYAEPLRLALQQVSWGRPSPLEEADATSIDVKLAPPGGGREMSQRLAKIETAISRRKTIEFSYYSMQRDEVSDRKVDPYHLVFRNGQFYLIAHSHERDEVRVFRLSRIRGKVSYATKAEHDFPPPEDFDRRDYASRADWQMGEIQGTAKVFVRERIAWLVERDFAGHGKLRKATKKDGVSGRGAIYETDYASGRQLISWVLGWRDNATLLEPEDLAREAAERLELLRERHSGRFRLAKTVSRPVADGNGRPRSTNGRSESVIRPERFARLVTLAGFLIGAAREDSRLPVEHRARRAQRQPAGAARGHRRAQRGQLRRRHVRALRGDRRRSRSRSTRTPTARTSPARPACCRSRRRRWSRRSTCSATTSPRRGCRPRARRSSPRSATTPRRRASRSPPDATTPRSSAPSTTRSSAAGCSSSTTTRRTRTSSSSARSSPTSWSAAPRAGTWAATTSAARTRATSASTG